MFQTFKVTAKGFLVCIFIERPIPYAIFNNKNNLVNLTLSGKLA
jgi:hypothetical protein